MGLSGLSRKPGFTSSKLLPVTENTEGITEHIPAAANPAGKPRARWPGRLEKQLPQRVSTRLLLLVSPERLFSRSWQKSQPGCHFTQPYPCPVVVCQPTPLNPWCHSRAASKGDSLGREEAWHRSLTTVRMSEESTKGLGKAEEKSNYCHRLLCLTPWLPVTARGGRNLWKLCYHTSEI